MAMRTKHVVRAGLAAMAILLTGALALADDRYWVGGVGNWSDPANWGGQEPTFSDRAVIENGGTAMVSEAGEQCAYLALGQNALGDGSIVIESGGELAVTADLAVGWSGTGVITQNGGSNRPYDVIVGSQPGSVGTYNLIEGSLTAHNEHIGGGGSGRFNQFGGTNEPLWLCLYGTPGNTGSYDMKGGP
jgi:hypothetical protein